MDLFSNDVATIISFIDAVFSLIAGICPFFKKLEGA